MLWASKTCSTAKSSLSVIPLCLCLKLSVLPLCLCLNLSVIPLVLITAYSTPSVGDD